MPTTAPCFVYTPIRRLTISTTWSGPADAITSGGTPVGPPLVPRWSASQPARTSAEAGAEPVPDAIDGAGAAPWAILELGPGFVGVGASGRMLGSRAGEEAFATVPNATPMPTAGASTAE